MHKSLSEQWFTFHFSVEDPKHPVAGLDHDSKEFDSVVSRGFKMMDTVMEAVEDRMRRVPGWVERDEREGYDFDLFELCAPEMADDQPESGPPVFALSVTTRSEKIAPETLAGIQSVFAKSLAHVASQKGLAVTYEGAENTMTWRVTETAPLLIDGLEAPAPRPGNVEQEPLREYEVEVTRMAPQTATLRVQATSMDEAQRKAIESAADHDFSGAEKGADYTVEDVRELEPKKKAPRI
jgi:hypothetical protein